jgi:hypothetical protein
MGGEMKSGENKATDAFSNEEAWTRFERAVDAAVKGGPKHRAAKEQVKAAPSKKLSKVNART